MDNSSVSREIWERDQRFVGQYIEFERMAVKEHIYRSVLEWIHPVPSDVGMPPNFVDLGAGTLTLAAKVLAVYPTATYTAVDNSRAMLESGISANNLTEHVQLGNLQIQQQDLLEPWSGIEDDSAGTVFAINLLYHFGEEQLRGRIIPELNRIIPLGGTFIMVNPLPTASISGIISEEVTLRGGGLRNRVAVVADVIKLLGFIIRQNAIQKKALKLDVSQWSDFMIDGHFQAGRTRQVYGGSASLMEFTLVKKYRTSCKSLQA